MESNHTDAKTSHENHMNYCKKEREYYECPINETFEAWLAAWHVVANEWNVVRQERGTTGLWKPRKEDMPKDQKKACFRKQVKYEDNPTDDTFNDWMRIWERLKDENPDIQKPQKSH